MSKNMLSFTRLISILCLLALGACKSGGPAVDGKVLNWVLPDDVKTFDTAAASDTVSHTVIPLIVESLFQYSYLKTPLVLEPLLAESMPKVSADGLTYVIKLKKGVKFQDDAAFPGGKGRELKAQDFIYGWKRLYNPKAHPTGSWIFDGKIAGIDEFGKKVREAAPDKVDEAFNAPIEGMKALDDYTIQIKLKTKYPQLLHVLAMPYSAPMAHELPEKYGQDGLTERAVGTGPFMLKSIRRGSRIVIVKNPGYREEKFPTEGDANAKASGLLAAAGKPYPFLDGISFSIVKEDQPMWLGFLKGDFDASGIPKDSFGAAINAGELSPELAGKGISLRKSDSPTIWFLEFNMKDKLVGTNADLRRAIVRTVDRKKFIDLFLNGRGEKAPSIVPPMIEGYTNRKEVVGDLNLDEAKRLLAKAGYPGGKDLPTIKLDLRGSDTTARQEAEFIAKAAAEIGVKIEVVPNSFPAYLEKAHAGNLQFFLGGWVGDYPDAENFVQLGYSKNVSPGPNESNYADPEFDKIYEKMAAMTPSPERTKLIMQAEDKLLGDAVWSMLFYPTTYTLSHKWLKNYRGNRMILNSLKYVDIDTAEKAKLLSSGFKAGS